VSLRRKVVRVRSLSWAQQRMALEALLWLGLLRVAVLVLPFRRTAALLRLSPTPATDETTDVSGLNANRHDPPVRSSNDGHQQSENVAENIGWAIRAVGARTPWTSTCLVQSLAGYMMLRRHKVTSVVYLGVAQDGEGDLEAHSWLRWGESLLTGASGYERYRPIAAYRATVGFNP
jgi:hypothetical protein